MSNVWLLVKVFFKQIMGLNFYTDSKKVKPKKINKVIAVIIILILLGSMIYYGIILFNAGYSSTKEVMKQSPDLKNTILAMVLPGISIVMFIASFLAVLSILYLSTDTEKIMHMPIKPSQILTARLIICYFSIFIIGLFFGMPLSVGVGVAANKSLLFYLYILIIFILLPIIPVILSSIICMVLMSFTSINKFRERYIYFVTVIGFILSLIIVVVFQSLPYVNLENGYDYTVLIELLSKHSALVFGYLFPPTIPAIYSLQYDNIFGLLFLLAYIIINLLAGLTLVFLGSKLYFKGLLNGKASAESKRKVVDKDYQDYSGVLGYAKKEWKCLHRSPLVFINLISPLVILPLTMAISFFVIVNIPEVKQAMDFQAIDYNKSSILFYFLAGIAFLCSMNLISACSISREGRSAVHLKYMPIKPAVAINGKIFIGFISSIITTASTYFLVVLAFKVDNIYYYTLFPLTLILLIYLMNVISLKVDLWKPKLEWDNQIVVVKQNLNFLLLIFSELFISLILVITGLLLNELEEQGTNLPIYLIGSVLFIVFLVPTVLYVIKVQKVKSDKIFENIQ